MNTEIKDKRYILELDCDEHEISVLQALFSLHDLPKILKKSFPEWKVEELEKMFNQIKRTIQSS